MSRGLNRAQIIGHLGADPTLRYAASGTPVATFHVAVNRVRRAPDGQMAEAAEWFRVVLYGRLAEVAADTLQRGARCYVEGQLHSRKYTGRDGVERTVVELIGHELLLLGGRSAATTPTAPASEMAPTEAGGTHATAPGEAAPASPEEPDDVPFD